MLARNILLALSALVGTVFAQNATTTIVTRVPVSTISTALSRTSTTLISASTVFSTSTLVSSYPTATATASSQILLDTKIDPAFGVLGALLILSGGRSDQIWLPKVSNNMFRLTERILGSQE
jgi:hypothetical protein